MSCALFAFEETWPQAEALARGLGIPVHRVGVHVFPDGESLIRVGAAPDTALLYRSLDRPNAKLVELLLAGSALRDAGAAKVILIAPYLAYMRQDRAFNPGEAVSQRVLGNLLAGHFDGVLTVDAHLHRVSTLDQVIKPVPAVNVSAASALAEALDGGIDRNVILVGPDVESRQWVESIADRLGVEVLLGEKRRLGDRDVRLVIPDVEKAHGRRAILVDDMISSGTTLVACAELLIDAGVSSLDAVATHCLASEADLARMKASGIGRLSATDSIPGSCASIPLSPVLAQAIRKEGWL